MCAGVLVDCAHRLGRSDHVLLGLPDRLRSAGCSPSALWQPGAPAQMIRAGARCRSGGRGAAALRSHPSAVAFRLAPWPTAAGAGPAGSWQAASDLARIMVTISQLIEVAMCARWARPNRASGANGMLAKVTAAAMAQASVGRA